MDKNDAQAVRAYWYERLEDARITNMPEDSPDFQHIRQQWLAADRTYGEIVTNERYMQYRAWSEKHGIFAETLGIDEQGQVFVLSRQRCCVRCGIVGADERYDRYGIYYGSYCDACDAPIADHMRQYEATWEEIEGDG